MRVIFLDIDGVMVTSRHQVRSNKYFGDEFDPICVHNLHYIISKTDASIVVTSSWREDRTFNQIKSIFKLNGFDNVIGMTPVIDGVAREREILAYIDTSISIDSYVIIDDDEQMVKLAAYSIVPDYRSGITEELAIKATSLLMEGNTL